MDANRFDRLARAVASRRAALGATFAAALGLAAPDGAAAACSKAKPCGPCRRCKQGRCKKKPDGKRCKGGVCRGGRCRKGGGGCNLPDHVCGETCCPPFTTCCNGTCCTGECVGNVCCKEPNRRCGTTCCGNNCCNNVCCAPGESCDPATGSCTLVCNTQFGEIACPGSEEGCCPRGMECCTFGSTNFCATTCIR